MCQVAISQFAVYEIPSRMFKEHFFLSDILKLRFFFPTPFQRLFSGPETMQLFLRVSHMSA